MFPQTERAFFLSTRQALRVACWAACLDDRPAAITPERWQTIIECHNLCWISESEMAALADGLYPVGVSRLLDEWPQGGGHIS